MKETRSVNFNAMPDYASQQTIVKVLKQVKYTFEPLNEYENTQFICETQHVKNGPFKALAKAFGAKVKDSYVSCPLAITICNQYSGDPIFEPMVFNREDVLKIISDVPENYVGPEEL